MRAQRSGFGESDMLLCAFSTVGMLKVIISRACFGFYFIHSVIVRVFLLGSSYIHVKNGIIM